MIVVFEYTDYRSYLSDALDEANSLKAGAQARLARFLACHPSYLSQVRKGRANFSLDQAQRVNLFFHHGDDASEYFLILVGLARAGTNDLRKELERQGERHRARHRNLGNRLKDIPMVEEKHRHIYYGSWHYAAIAMALTVPKLRKAGAIAKEFGLPKERVQEVLDFLVQAELAKTVEGEFYPGKSWLHLSEKSDLSAKDHLNWRLKAIQSLEKIRPNDLHYSAVISLSESDLKKLKERLIQTVKDCLETVKPSREEKIACMMMDFFSLADGEN